MSFPVSETMSDRIRKLRKSLDLTQQDFGSRIGIKRNSVALIESGRNTSDQTVVSICREFGVNESWLRTGEGEMFSPAPSFELDAVAKRYNLSHGAYILIEKFIKAGPENQQVILDLILEIAAALADGEVSAATRVFGGGPDVVNGAVAAAEAVYEKSLNSAPGTDASLSSTSEGTA